MILFILIPKKEYKTPKRNDRVITSNTSDWLESEREKIGMFRLVFCFLSHHLLPCRKFYVRWKFKKHFFFYFGAHLMEKCNVISHSFRTYFLYEQFYELDFRIIVSKINKKNSKLNFAKISLKTEVLLLLILRSYSSTDKYIHS